MEAEVILLRSSLESVWGASIQSPGTASTSWQFFPRPPLQTWSLNSMDWFSMFVRLLFESTSDRFSLFGLRASLWKIAFPYSSISCSSATRTLVPQLQSYAQKSLGCRVFQLSLFQLSPMHICQNQWGFPQSHYIWHTCQGLPWMRICMWCEIHPSSQLHQQRSVLLPDQGIDLLCHCKVKADIILGQPLIDACWDTFRIGCTVVWLFSGIDYWWHIINSR